MNNEFEILERYQNSDEVKTLMRDILRGTPEQDTKATPRILKISERMMIEAGAKLTAQGQWRFADVVFFDFFTTDQDKIQWLKGVEEAEGFDQSERIAYLKKKLDFQKSGNAKVLVNESGETTTTSTSPLSKGARLTD